MKDPRQNELAGLVLDYSISLQKGEHVLIEGFGISSRPFVEVLIDEIYKRGACPYVQLHDDGIRRRLLLGSSAEMLDLWSAADLYRMKQMDAWIAVTSHDNFYNESDIPAEVMERYSSLYTQPVHFEERLANTKWLVLRYPNSALAQLAEMSLESFEDYFFRVCSLDYGTLSAAMEQLAVMMNEAETVRITGPGTEFIFSIKEMPVVKCDGKENLPDGEVFTAPVRGSISGTVLYNCPTVYNGKAFTGIALTIKNGKIIDAASSDTEALNAVLDTDEGARYFGEFALGVNPRINRPMKEPLFDEKIAGSFHLTPGKAYREAYNGNESAIHWDLVCIQTAARGGGEIYFDGKLVRKDGFFIDPALADLNPA